MERTSSPIIPLLLFWRKASASSIKRRTLQGSMVQRKHKIINEMMHYHPYSTFLTSSATPTPCLPSDYINHYLSLLTLIPPLPPLPHHPPSSHQHHPSPHYHITLPPHPLLLVWAQSNTLCMAVTPSFPIGTTSPPVIMAYSKPEWRAKLCRQWKTYKLL